MEEVVPWARLVQRLQPALPERRARPAANRAERMLRVYFGQQWYGLADEAIENAFYDSQALRGLPASM
jgi:transposase, IS5 family